MKVRNLAMTVLITLAMIGNLHARDERVKFSINDALTTDDAISRLDQGVKFYFGKNHPKVIKSFGNFMANKKTNAFNKSDKVACEWAFLSAMLTFQKRAKQLGANAVINIKSYYKRGEFVSSTEYECGAGNVVAGVTFRGDVVKIK